MTVRISNLSSLYNFVQLANGFSQGSFISPCITRHDFILSFLLPENVPSKFGYKSFSHQLGASAGSSVVNGPINKDGGTLNLFILRVSVFPPLALLLACWFSMLVRREVLYVGWTFCRDFQHNPQRVKSLNLPLSPG